MQAPSLTPCHEESGLTLIELIIALVVSAIVVAAAATILVNSWLAQEDVTSTTEATTRGQLMGSTIERAMRNAKDFTVAPNDDDGTELRVWTSLGGSLTCQGFQLAVGEARIATSSGSLPVVGNWGVWDVGVAKQGSKPFLQRSGNTVTYSFELATDSAPVPISGQAKMRTIKDSGEVSPCWP
ncbi:prepilin-type N-terminal cleavage/methylation domain-containing protein [Microbacterium sp. ProA8]|uniref:prepilin-type N-terminal cleavage/methylation domain-containing protein n=1 Tax=Microbacterium chionoecetis TaxID=3153754 RepID=UPI0032636F1D